MFVNLFSENLNSDSYLPPVTTAPKVRGGKKKKNKKLKLKAKYVL